MPIRPPDSHSRAPGGLAYEASLVAAATVGVGVFRLVVDGRETLAAIAFTNTHLVSLLVYEVVLAALFVPWLARRGWSPRLVGKAPEPIDVVRGVGLWFAAYVAFVLVFWIGYTIQPDVLTRPGRFPGLPASPVVAIITSVANPVFEEFLWLGYAVTRLAPAIGTQRAAAMSIMLRTAVHLYQGPMAIAGVLPLAVVFTWYYVRKDRIWPVIVAHILFDAIGLAARLPAR